MEIPYSHPIVPKVMFAPNNVPPVQIPGLPPQLTELIPIATMEVLNRAMDAAGRNAMRTYMLNCLVINNYQNNELPMTVDFVLRQAVVDCIARNDHISSVRTYIPHAAEQILGLISSVKGVAHQGIRAILSSSDLQAAYTNNGAYDEIVRTLKMVDFRIFQAPQQQGQQVTYGTPAPFHSNYQPQFSGGVPATDGSPSAGTLGAQWGGAPQPAAAPEPLRQADWFASANNSSNPPSWGSQSAWTNQSGQQQQPAVPLQELAQPSYGVPVSAEDFRQSLSNSAVSTFEPIVTAQGENEMDYNVHALVYFGNGQPLDLSGRRTDLKIANLSLSQAGRKSVKEGDVVLLSRSLAPEISLDNAIFTATTSLLASATAEGDTPSIYRQFLNIIQPVACSHEVMKIMDTLMAGSTNLENLAANISFGLKAAIKDPIRPSAEELGALNALAFLDRRLTVEINRFIKLGLALDVKIGSFTEDYKDLPGYMSTKGSMYNTAFLAWSTRYFDHIKSNMDDSVKAFLDGYFSTESVGSLYLPSVQSLTILNVTYKELGYQIDGDEPVRIDPKTTMNLYDIAEGLRANKRDLNVHTTLDWLVTADDHRFILSELATEPGKFMLSRG